MTSLKLFGRKLENLRLYREFQEIGFDYIVNPNTGELHRVGWDGFWGSHNLVYADLNNFIGLTNLGVVPIHVFRDGTSLPIYDLETGELIENYVLNKCQYCFSS
ncbi:hypothetical protein [Nostoc sp. 'Peltigera membranacea cyanobiont' N6]|uniref:hypothetical protein n=1 Tax=Nostoc sp. 'Peltigera membranacea cyanobiont' N6 TaxID=1261031 RepID=UPI000CF30342|nr:hypothetical protein [Nostoc sp. 'Peltigera membranacea cyanobiont' N6]AVH65989.1 hypothetical protein NPM_4459 [Nostoc sp. 'Peltigera membranacea cyanobiont' N6]